MDIPHASFRAPCNRLYPLPGPPERGPGRRRGAEGPGRPRGRSRASSPRRHLISWGSRPAVSGKCRLSPSPSCLEFTDINPNGCWLTPNSDTCVQRGRQRQAGRDRQTETDRQSAFMTQEPSMTTLIRKQGSRERASQGCVSGFALALVLNSVSLFFPMGH